mmetsp:Transcript_2345/g.4308  ORF Transcript_2345/g.4308 Transcript_2345/m.4308 type:complete len:403 (+) Transcript_2345:2033-3241(+)
MLPPSKVVAAVSRVLVSVVGSMDKPVRNVHIQNVTFTQSATTYMQKYEVPSGGDWSIHRGGAIFVSGAEGFALSESKLSRLGGNGVFLSGYVRDALIKDNHISFIGDTAIAMLGDTKWAITQRRNSTDLMDGTAGNQPRNVEIRTNVIHDIGVYGKQTSAVAAAISGNVSIIENVMFNGPRAGINFNDGFLGGNKIAGNLLFNWVRETGDHGNFNSWDRLPFITGMGVNRTDIVENSISGNMMINNFHSTWPIDHDDGSCFFNDTNNLLIYGGAKNYLGHTKVSTGNLYVYANLNGPGSCMIDDSSFGNDVYAENRCITSTGFLYKLSTCDVNNLNKTAEITYKNQIFSPKKIFVPCRSNGKAVNLTLEDLQNQGYELGSKVSGLPSNKQVQTWARQMLHLQ